MIEIKKEIYRKCIYVVTELYDGYTEEQVVEKINNKDFIVSDIFYQIDYEDIHYIMDMNENIIGICRCEFVEFIKETKQEAEIIEE